MASEPIPDGVEMKQSGGDGGMVANLSKGDRNYATLLIADAVNREVSMYYVNNEGKAASVWAEGGQARRMGLFLRHPWITGGLSALAFLDMMMALISPPTNFETSDGVKVFAIVIQLTIWVINMVFCALRVFYMLGSIGSWFKGSKEPPWVVVQILVLFFLSMSEWIVYFASGYDHKEQVNGLQVKCPNSYSVFIHGWARAWTWIYFNPGVRDALNTLLQVFLKLGPITGLMLSFFVSHFSVFQGLAVGVACPGAAAGDTHDRSSCNEFGPGGDIWTALWNLFGLLTTVNHPDVMMWLVDTKWASFLVILSYMFFTNIIGLNLLLAIVYGEYVSILEGTLEHNAELRSVMLDTAFDILDPDNDGTLTPDELVSILRNTTSESSMGDDQDRLEMIARLVDNKSDESGEEAKSLQDGQISREDLHEILVFYSAPLFMKSADKPAVRFEQAIQALEDRKASTQVPEEVEVIDHQIAEMNAMGPQKWSSTYRDVYYWVYEFGAGFDGPIEDEEALGYEIWPLAEDSYFVQIHTLYFLVYLVYSIFQTAKTTYTDGALKCLMFSAIYQLVYVVILFVAEMRPWALFHFLYPKNKSSFPNIINFILLVALWVEWFAQCHSGKDGCLVTHEKDPGNRTAIVASVLGKICQVISFSVETRSVLLLIESIMKTLPTLGPHFGLFLAVYYGFAGMGISFFCGLAMEHPCNGGPGYWGQSEGYYEWSQLCDPTVSTCMTVQVPAGDGSYTLYCPPNSPYSSVSKAEGMEWGSTAYGGNPYYYNLNFNGFANAIAILWVVMIQNNWTSAADGPVQVTNKSYRWYFFIFTLVNAFVMINVLVGAIIDALDAVRQSTEAAFRGEMDPLEELVTKRIAATTAPSGRMYSATWELGPMPLHGEVRFDAALCPALFTSDDQELQDKKIELMAQSEVLDAELAAMTGQGKPAAKGSPRSATAVI